MRRRAFCTSAVLALGAAAMPLSRVFAAASGASADLGAVTGDGRQVTIPRAAIEEFRAALRGQLLLRDDAGYDAARRIWNGMIDRHPALIARCAGPADVVQCVNFARDHQLLVAVRGGGHSLSGQSVCENGLMIDLAPMRSVRVDAARKLARIEPGVLLGDLDRESLAFGLVTTTGTVSHTGAAGLTLGGGFGRLARKYGMACDNVSGVDIVTPNGQLLQADAAQNSDLYWAVRGGGGNFGVVTSFEYRLHAFDPMIFGGVLVYPISQARAVCETYAELAAVAPDEFWGELALIARPDGERVVMVEACYCGSMASGARATEPLQRLGRPLQGTLGPIRYGKLQTNQDERARHGRRYYTKSGFTTTIQPGLIDVILERFAAATIASPRIAFPQKGGAIGRVAREATAFWHRDAAHTVIVQASGEDPAQDEANIAWVRATMSAVEPFTIGVYSNMLSPESPQQQLLATYGGNYQRLAALKAKYDPTNLLRLNANIKPQA